MDDIAADGEASDVSETALIDELLAAQQQHAAATSGDEDMDDDLDLAAMAHDLLGSEVEGGDQQNPVVVHDDMKMKRELARAQQDPRKVFGDSRALAHLGNQIQLQIMKKVFWALQHSDRRNRNNPAQAADDAKQKSIHGTILSNFVKEKTAMKSLTVVAESSGFDFKSLKLGLEANSCAMLQGACWLLGACCLTWRTLFRQKKARPIAFISKWRYDETPLRLRVDEMDEFYQQLGLSEQLSAAAKKTVWGDHRYTKILRVEWTLGISDLDLGKRKIFGLLFWHH